jgi:hypothetical protein
MAYRRSRAGLAAGTLALLCASSLQAGTSTLANPVVVFSSAGLKTVTLRVCNSGGCTESRQTIEVLDPMPKVTAATVSTAAAEVGQLLRLDATGTGRPTLAFSWRILLGGSLVATIPGATAYWHTGNLPAGSYAAVLRLSNADGFVDSAPLPVTLAANANTKLYTVAPCRLVDTRDTGTPLLAGVPRLVPTALGDCQVPVGARAVVANVTVTGGTGAGAVKIYPGDYPEPEAAMVNFKSGATRANFGILPLSTDGLGSLRAVAAMPVGGSVHLVVDVTGYFAP